MPTIVQTQHGKVSALWGAALIRTPDGHVRALQIGDVVNRGDVVLTTQDGIVRLEDLDAPTMAAAPKVPAPADTDIDRVIAELNQPDALTAPAAGLTGGGGGGLTPGLRVDRIAEDITPASLELADTAAPAPATTPIVPTTPTGDGVAATPAQAPAPTPAGPPPAPQNTAPSAIAGNASGLEDSTLPLPLRGSDADGNVVSVTIVSIPAGASLLLADGVTVVTAGQTLSAADAAGLLFKPAADFNGNAGVSFTVTDNSGAVSAPASVAISVTPVNDLPVATSVPAGSGLEDTAIAVHLGGSDIDGSVTSVTVTTLPQHGTLYLPDGTTPVSAGTPISAADAANLVFRPDPNYHGSTDIGFTVTDNEGGTSAPVSVPVTVTPEGTTITLTASAATVTEGGSLSYTATLNNPVAGSPLVITLSNGSTITIPVGQTSGSSAPVPVRADDAYAQGPQTVAVSVTQASGGDFASLDPNASTSSTVVDDADATSLTLSPSATTLAEGGSIVYTATLNNPVTGSPLVITLDNGQTITIPVGQSSASSAPFVVRGDDAYAQGTQTLTVGVASTSGGNFEGLAPAAPVSTSVTDNGSHSTVVLSASAASVTEGGSIVYTATVSSPVSGTPLVLTLDNGQTITIPVGQSSASSAPFAVRADDVLAQGPQTVTATIAGSSGGGYESLTPVGSPSTSVTDDADATTVSLSATPAVAEGGSIVYTATLGAPAATDVTVTLSNGATITIAAGASSGSVAHAAPADSVYADAGSVSATINGATGGGFEQLTVNPAAATTAVSDTVDTTTVTLTASPSVVEGGSIVYTASLGAPALTPVTVTLSNGDVITIAAGASSGSVAHATGADDVYTNANTVSTTISSASGGQFENLALNPAPATTSVADSIDTTTVSITGSNTVNEGAAASYTLSLTSPAQTAVTVTLSYSGTAADGSDFTGVTTVTIPAGSSSATFSVAALTDGTAEGPEQFTVSIAGATGGNFENLAISAGSGSVNTGIVDADTATLSLSATPALTEAGGSIVYTATLSQAPTTDLSVTLSNGAVITVQAGHLSGSTSVALPASDDVYVDPGSVSASIQGATGGGIPITIDATPAVTAVNDSIDTTTVSLAATPNATEGGSITYTATLTAAAQGPVTVNLSNGDVITIAAGATTGSVSHAAPANDVYTGSSTVSVSIANASGGNFEQLAVDPTAAQTLVTDSVDTTTVRLVASASAVEGGNITYTAQLTAVAQADVTVTLSNGATITILAGAQSGSVSHPAPADDVYTDAGTVSATITGATGGKFENLAIDSTPAQTAIGDSIDATTLTLSAPASAVEGGSITYTATLGAAAQTPVSLRLSNGATITIAAGATTGSVSIAAPADDAYAGHAPVSASITGATGGNFEQLDVDTTPRSTSITDSADTTTLSLSASGSVTEGGSITYTATLTQAAQTPLTVNLSNGDVITIAAGATTGSVTHAAPANDVYLSGGTISATIANASGGNFENLSVDPTAASTTLTDSVDATTVVLAATPSVVEGGSIVYTATLGAVAQAPVLVTLSNGDTITIAAGQFSGSVSHATAANDVYVNGGTVSTTIASAVGGNFEQLAPSAAAATTTVTDSVDTTTLSITGSGSVTEGASAGYTLSLTSPAQGPVTVTLSYSGTAADGSDYTGIATVTIPAGSSSATFSIPTLDDAVAEGSEHFTVSVASATGGGFESLVVSAANGSVTTGIVDNDSATLSLSATSGLTEAGGNIVYTATLTQAPVSDLSVTLSNGAVITIAAGQLSGTATVAVAPGDDVYVDPTSVSATIQGTSGGGILLSIDPTAAVTAIADTVDTTTVTLKASATSVAEGGSIVYTASVDHPVTGSPLVLVLSNGQSITIAVGQSSGNSAPFAVRPDDAYAQGDQPLNVGIVSHSGANYENLATGSTVATTVTDNASTTTVTLSASTASVAEGGSIVYTASVNQPVSGQDFVVTLSNGQTITIPVGQSSADSAPFAVRGDDAYAQGTQALNVGVSATSGGNYEAVAHTSTVSTAVTDDGDLTTVTLKASSATVAEGTGVNYTATLDHAVTGTDFVITLSNGQTITIPVGQSSASSPAVVLRADDVDAQGSQSVVVGVTGTAGGNFEALNTASTASTTVTDDADATTVTLKASSSSVSEGGSIVYTAELDHAVSGQDLVLTLTNGQSITIAVGQTSGSTAPFAVRADDAYAQGTQTLNVGVSSHTGGNFEALDTGSTVGTDVTDNGTQTVATVTASAGAVAEGTAVSYTVTLNQAVTGSDFSVTLSNGQSVTIPVGQSSASTAALVLRGDDAHVQGTQTVSVGITGTSGGNFEAVNGSSTAQVDVSDDADVTTVSLSGAGSVAEGASAGYTLTLDHVAATPVTVTLSYSGVAADGSDYTGVATVTIPAGSSSAGFNLATIDDALAEGTESFTVTVTGASGGGFESLAVGSANSVTTAIVDNDVASVSLSATPGLTEAGGSITYTATLTQAPVSDMTVTLSNGASITIQAGHLSGTTQVAMAASDDVYVDPTSVSATIQGTSGGGILLSIDPTPAVTAIADTVDTTTVTLSA
ncbi:immunoglobulin-like domain-containing protein, partial [Rhizobacter sp. Root29]|uniref:immunoglobulin-like domain-containing protein n=1 Tax=Rhizobacter sp. Root29 TaxID=1736511 RepID=UPI001F224EC2